jgi:hypothetical protein
MTMPKFAVLATLAAATVGVTLPAQAGNIGGFEALHVSESNTRYSPDVLTVLGPAGVEKITVICGQGPFDPAHDWNSYGPNSADWVDYVAKQWCF